MTRNADPKPLNIQETKDRLREAVGQENAPGFDLEEHIQNVAVEVAARRFVADNRGGPDGNLSEALRERIPKKP